MVRMALRCFFDLEMETYTQQHEHAARAYFAPLVADRDGRTLYEGATPFFVALSMAYKLHHFPRRDGI